MICKNCGKEFFESDGKCPFCDSEVASEIPKSSTGLEGDNPKKDKKKTLKIVLIVAISIIAAAGIAFGAVALVKHFKGKDQAAALPEGDIMVGEAEITYEEIQYYYFASYKSLVENAILTDQQYGDGYYAEYQGFDHTKTLTEQSFPNDLLPEEETKTYKTWDDYIFEQVLESLQYLYALEAEAEKAGVKLTEDEKTSALAELEEMKSAAEASDMTLEEYLEDNYGTGIKEEDLKKWMLRDALASKYLDQKMEELSAAVTDAEINSEFEKNRNDYVYADLRLYVFNVDMSANLDGKTEEKVEAIRTEAENKAKKEAEDFLSNVVTETDFINEAKKLDEEMGVSAYTEETTNFPQAQYAILEQAFGKDDAEWIMDKTRKSGDKKVFAYKENDEVVSYYAVYIVKPSYKDAALWEDEVRNVLGYKAYQKYEDELIKKDAYTIAKGDNAEKGLSDLRKKISAEIKKRLESKADASHSFVEFTMANGGSFIVELYPEYAPKTVENFLKLVETGFYDGLTFHRVIEGFMAQGGDPSGNGTGGSDEEIYGEFIENGFYQNTLSHDRGVISMARSNDPNSASSQFFICYSGDHKAALDGKYAAFGKVIEGMEVVDAFLDVERVYSASDATFSTPTEPIVIEKAVVIANPSDTISY